jgi:hypothetical protein
MADFPEFDPQYEYLDPSELGWVEIEPHIWKKPNGELYRFPPGNRRDVIVRIVRLVPGGRARSKEH